MIETGIISSIDVTSSDEFFLIERIKFKIMVY